MTVKEKEEKVVGAIMKIDDVEKFRKICKDNHLNSSAVIRALISKFCENPDMV